MLTLLAPKEPSLVVQAWCRLEASTDGLTDGVMDLTDRWIGADGRDSNVCHDVLAKLLTVAVQPGNMESRLSL
jgi:hypothetical protein